ncbi:HAMP domain-containing sensor histidine kinase [Aliiglaciecola sp. CAU 1673]|uniref:sensor histidine kinase n=1 Tax=Aliiglaciecola sp. CAU 1673 TaxID=3032595 RepID=UPI0023DC0F71|nr:HAMP domain-containing sensor histidine kinase [Aliiglaciecola sp. CAU 1673]MDF2178112.1 HAMP domain-containing sensor histidine kinase [Aliiglaciecola sp. CAU 1673]
MKTLSLKRRILFSFAGFSAFVALLFGAMSFMFAYNTEDLFFNAMLEREADYLQANPGMVPRQDFIQRYPNVRTLPEAVRAVLDEEPQRVELASEDGRYYHLLKMKDDSILLADVSNLLIVRHIKAGMLEFLLVLFSLVLLGALLIAFVINNRLLSPLSTLTQLISNVSLTQLPSGFSKAFRQDEVGLLASKLEDATQRIQAFVQREQDFTRDISHELRTPITVSRGALELLKQHSTTEQAPYLSRLTKAQQDMQQILDVLFALAREESVTHQSSGLGQSLESSVLSHEKVITEKGLEIELEVDNKTKVNLSSTVLEMIFGNLIGNAVLYTEQGQINIRQSGSMVAIKDSGPGIADSEVVFRSGQKGAQSEGLGMGLSIVKRLCQKFEIGLELESSSKGSCFTLDFSKLLTAKMQD